MYAIRSYYVCQIGTQLMQAPHLIPVGHDGSVAEFFLADIIVIGFVDATWHFGICCFKVLGSYKLKVSRDRDLRDRNRLSDGATDAAVSYNFV